MIEPEIAFANLSDNAALADALLKYAFTALLKEREEDLAFFDKRVEKGLARNSRGIVGSEFVHMGYGEAIEVLAQANEKFEFPATWGIDLQSEHERYLTEKCAKKPVIVMNYPKDIKAFYMRVRVSIFAFRITLNLPPSRRIVGQGVWRVSAIRDTEILRSCRVGGVNREARFCC
jgi:asparaginyl-tRNA synthetase